jgi:hypothetical protein
MLGGLFGSKPVDPSKTTAPAANNGTVDAKVHGPFPVSIELYEYFRNDGKRDMKVGYTTTIAKKDAKLGRWTHIDVDAFTTDELTTKVKDAYKDRLEYKNSVNAAAKKAKAEADAKAAKAKADAQAKAEQDKADAEEKIKILKFLKERRITPTTSFLSKKISENDKKQYNSEIYRNSTTKPAGPKPLAGPLAGPIGPPPQGGGKTRKNRNRKNKSRKNRH